MSAAAAPSSAGRRAFAKSTGFEGGGEWGGAAVDRATAPIYVNASDVPWVAAMRPARDADTAAMPTTGAAVYAASCAGCHGADRRGDGNRVPSLVGVGTRLTAAQIGAIVEHGRGFMPAVRLEPAARRAVIAYLRGRGDAAVAGGAPTRPRRSPSPAAPDEFAGYERGRAASGLAGALGRSARRSPGR